MSVLETAHSKAEFAYSSPGTDEATNALVTALDAISAAALALAEEHRTANLIAALTATAQNGAAIFPQAYTLRQEVLARLGLGDQS